LLELWLANQNLYNINSMIARGVEVPFFRFSALEEEFVKKMTEICRIFSKHGKLDQPYDIRQMLEILKTKDWRNIEPFAYYLNPLNDAFEKVV